MVTGESCKAPGILIQEEEVMAEIDEEENMICIEHKVRGYESPEFVLFVLEEKRIAKPWEKGIINKMLGQKISFKALKIVFSICGREREC